MSLYEQALQKDKENCREIGKKFEDSWANINIDEQKELINELVDFLCKRLKIKDNYKPQTIIKKLPRNYYGA